MNKPEIKRQTDVESRTGPVVIMTYRLNRDGRRFMLHHKFGYIPVEFME